MDLAGRRVAENSGGISDHARSFVVDFRHRARQRVRLCNAGGGAGDSRTQSWHRSRGSEPRASAKSSSPRSGAQENIQNIPVSVGTVDAQELAAINTGGADIRGLSGRVPSLNIESSFGRTFPRFYIRGLGNTDFDLNASQPVSLVYDDVVLENPILKGFPAFDLDRIQVLRGPQGTLFGRNTPAGIVKFDTVRPGQWPKLREGSATALIRPSMPRPGSARSWATPSRSGYRACGSTETTGSTMWTSRARTISTATTITHFADRSSSSRSTR